MVEIDSCPGYFITTDGRVWSEKSGKWLSADSRRYAMYTLYLGGGLARREYAHRLVAQAYIPNPENKPQVNHINGDKKDNRVENLEWSTKIENQRHAYATGLNTGIKGSKSHLSKMADNTINLIRLLYGLGFKQRELAEMAGCSISQVSRIVTRQNWGHI